MPYTENNMMDTKERLEELRKEKKLSYGQLSKILEAQGVTISHTNLKNYEINDELHALYNRTRGMSLENFVALADVFDVSVDYLLGRSKSRKAEYHQMSEELNLSDAAIDTIKDFQDEDREVPTYATRSRLLNWLLLMPEIIEAFDYLQSAVIAMEVYGAFGEKKPEGEENTEKLIQAERELMHYGLKAVDAKVVADVHVSRALMLVEKVMREIPAEMIEEYRERLEGV